MTGSNYGPQAPKNDGAARALYDGVITALRAADTLSYESSFRREREGQELSRSTCRLRMKKPNYARVEAVQDGEVRGVLVLGGERLWLYWPKERPFFFPADGSKAQHAATCRNVYMTKPAPLARHSIAHEVDWTGGAHCILDPSTFHGYTDSLQSYVDSVTGLGLARIDDEECDGIEISFMDHQRSWFLWLSRRDHLPRRVREVVRVAHEIVSEETWSNVDLNGEIPMETFTWTPPPGWREWRPATPDEILLRPGTPAPDFALAGIRGETIRLSDHRGQVVWLAVWRAG